MDFCPRTLCLVAWASLVACGPARATQLVLSVNTDFAVPAELDQVRMEVHTQDDSKDFTTRVNVSDVTLDSRAKLPLTLALSKRGKTDRVQVTVSGLRDQAVVVRRRAIASFQDRRILSLPVDLVRACARKYEQCEQRALTCGDSGGCESVERTQLDPWHGIPNFSAPAASGPSDRDEDPKNDAGMANDAGNTPMDPDASDIDGGADAGMATVAPDPNEVSDFALGGGHSCALLRSGAVYCWGANESGQLGRGNDPACLPTADQVCFVPAQVIELPSDIVKIAAGAKFTCALRSQNEGQGQVLCWGENLTGQLGSERASSSFPAYVLLHGRNDRLQGANALAAGRKFACARVAGSLNCWGDNSLRQLAINNDGWFPDYVAAAVPHSLSQVDAFDLGDDFGCARAANSVRCWGANEKRQLGVAETIGDTVVTPWTQLPDELALGGEHTCLRVGTQIYCAGRAEEGQLGIDLANEFVDLPSFPNTVPGSDPPQDNPLQGKASCTEVMRPVSWMAAPISVGAGTQGTCALDERENVWCWGNAVDGLPVNDFLNATVELPRKVPRLSGVVRFGVGATHACAFTRTKETFCWGGNKTGQLGMPAAVNPLLPGRVSLPMTAP